MPGWVLRIRATSSSPSVPGILKSMSAMSTAPPATVASASSALAHSTSDHSGRIRRKALAITMRASLLSSTTKILYGISELLVAALSAAVNGGAGRGLGSVGLTPCQDGVNGGLAGWG